MPTLLELIGIDPPPEINGVRQRPIEGVSFAPTLGDPQDPGRHTTQYYEMLGSRALYHDGWKAVVFRPLAFVRYTADDDPFRSFEDDDWELYHVAEDFSETRDLAADASREAGRARRHLVARGGALQRAPRDQHARSWAPIPAIAGRRYVFYPGIGTIPQLVAPNISNRAWSHRVPSWSCPRPVPTVPSSATGAMPVVTWSFSATAGCISPTTTWARP